MKLGDRDVYLLEMFMCTECRDGNFGDDCMHTCNCKDESEVCNKQNGECEQSGCAPGVKDKPGCQEGNYLYV